MFTYFAFILSKNLKIRLFEENKMYKVLPRYLLDYTSNIEQIN